MRYDYEYDVNKSGRIILKDLPFLNRYVENPREEQFRKLYSYVLINIDLYYALSFLELCTQTVNDIERQCFFRMAVIQYSKCYSPSKNGGRSQIDAARVYKNLPDDPIGCHDKFIEMRNKYFAHDENDFKALKLGAVLNIDEQKIMGIAYPRMQAKFDYDCTIAILKKLCERTKEWVCTKLDEEVDRVSKYIEQRGFDIVNRYEDLTIFD